MFFVMQMTRSLFLIVTRPTAADDYVRFWLGNQVDPDIALSLARTEVGGRDSFAYTYKLENGSGAVTGLQH
jgi:hypothetical protein